MEITQLGCNPISEQAPAGADARFEPDFEALSTEMAKLSSPTASGAVDWQRVADLSGKLLETKSKDLLVACYLCIALMQTRGLEGLADGIHVLGEMAAGFWDTLFPTKKRMKGRMNALSWWKERVDAYLPSIPAATWPKAQRDALLSEVAALNDFLGAHLDEAPMLTGLINNLTERITEQPPAPAPAPNPEPPPAAAPDSAKAPPAAAAPPPPPPPPAAPRPPATGKPSADADPRNLVDSGLDILDQAATRLMAADPFDPAVYRLNRIAAWAAVDNPPPAEGGKTLLPPPSEMVRTALSRLSESGSWRDLLDAAEARVREYRFWLDLSRHTAEALSHLGRSAVGDQVARDTRHYTRRLPGIETLQFADGTPFADRQTRDWLKDPEAGGPAAGGAGAGRQGDAMTAAMAAAEEQIRQNRLGEALNGLRNRMAQAGSLRERFLWQLGICRLMVSAHKSPLARPYINGCLALIDEYQIEKWEPALAAEALATALRGFQDSGEKADGDLMKGICDRLSFLDPMKALEFMG